MTNITTSVSIFLDYKKKKEKKILQLSRATTRTLLVTRRFTVSYRDTIAVIPVDEYAVLSVFINYIRLPVGRYCNRSNPEPPPRRTPPNRPSGGPGSHSGTEYMSSILDVFDVLVVRARGYGTVTRENNKEITPVEVILTYSIIEDGRVVPRCRSAKRNVRKRSLN